MKNTNFLIIVFCLAVLAMAGEAKAFPLVVNSDHTVSIQGEKVFPVTMYNLCSSFVAKGGGLDKCASSLAINNNAIFHYDISQNPGVAYLPLYEAAGTGFSLLADSSFAEGSPMAYTIQLTADCPGDAMCDEPDYNNPTIREHTLQNLQNAKNNLPALPIWMNNWDYMTSWLPYVDIYAWDGYANSRQKFANYYAAEDVVYAHEKWFAQSMNGKKWNDPVFNNKTVWAVIAAYASTTDPALTSLTEKEARAMTWDSIANGAQGISYYGWLPWGDSTPSPGVHSDSAKAQYYRDIATEIRSLNSILILPTTALFWENDKTTSYINIMPNPSKTVYSGWSAQNRFTYLLKQPNANISYLIAVNKDSTPSSNVQISVNGISGTRTVKFLGNKTTGSGRSTGSDPSHVLTSNNGIFTDSFDGYAVHIYQICAAGDPCTVPAPPPPPASDTTPPAISITCPGAGPYSSPTISVSGTASDSVGLSKIEVKAGAGGTYQTATGTTSWSISGLTLASGANTVYAKATDTSGNTKETSITVTYDSTASPGYTTPFNSTGAASIIVNSDKTLSINGRKLFPQIIGPQVCNALGSADTQASCIAKLTSVRNHTATTDGSGYGTVGDPLPRDWYNAAGFIGFIPQSYYHTPDSHRNTASPYLFGFMGRYDEPSTSAEHDLMVRDYADNLLWKPGRLSISGLANSGPAYEDTGDVMVFGLYPYQTRFFSGADMCPGGRNKIQYCYEHIVKHSALEGGGTYNNFDETQKPFWLMVQSLAGADDAGAQPTTLAEGRAMRYNAITMNTKGIAYWAYGSTMGSGLEHNQAKLDEHNAMTDEINYLSDILVLPTKDYSWNFRRGSGVTFNKTLPYIGYWNAPYANWNYMLKQDGSRHYLIVLNKDNQPVSNVEITIAGLSGNANARTIGLTQAGSNPGRVLPVVNGKFTDSFNGLEAIVYQICPAGDSCAAPSGPGAVPPACTSPTPAITPTPVPTPACTPTKTCADYPLQCWSNLFNGCSYVLDCSGTCVSPQVCNTSVGFCTVPTPAPYFIPSSVKIETVPSPLHTITWPDLISSTTSWILGIISSVVLLFLIIGGLFYIGSAGSEERMVLGKRIITYAIVGLIIILISYSIVTTFNKIIGG